MTALAIRNASVYYPVPRKKTTVHALKDINLEIKEKDFVVALGASGCGKSTLLNLIAGFMAPSQGEITLGGKIVTGPGADRSVVFQKHALLPWLNVLDNVAFGLKIQHRRREDRERIARSFIKLLGLEQFEQSPTYQLSGGMQQRVSIARALAFDPKLLLMDEPFGALDEIVRDKLNQQLLELWDRTGKTIVFVTHSIPEAVFLSTKIIVMSPRPGRIIDVIESNLPRNRTLDMRETPAFLKIAQRVREGLKAGHSYED